MTLDSLIILIKSVLKKDQNQYYYNSIIMLRFEKTWTAKEKFYAAKNQKMLRCNVDDIVIWKLVKITTNSKYFFGYLDTF